MKRSGIFLIYVNTPQLSRVTWKFTNKINIKGSDIPVTNVNILPPNRKSWNNTKNQIIRLSDIPVTIVKFLLLLNSSGFTEKSTKNQNLMGSDTLVLNICLRRYKKHNRRNIWSLQWKRMKVRLKRKMLLKMKPLKPWKLTRKGRIVILNK